MRGKLLISFLLLLAVCGSFVACGTPKEPVPEISREELAEMDDEELISVLLERYAQYTEPAVFSAELSYRYRSGDTMLAQMEGTVRSNGVDRILSLTRTVKGKDSSENYVQHNGMCYLNNGTKKTKGACESADAAAYFTSFYPTFGTVSDYNFAQQDLLRGDDGAFFLVLSIPANGVADSVDYVTPLTFAQKEDEPVTLSDFSQVYLTLRFSSEGKLTGQTLGFDCKINSDGAVTEGDVLFTFALISTAAVQTPISAPDGAESYESVTKLPFLKD